jgi:hypothetical protein
MFYSSIHVKVARDQSARGLLKALKLKECKKIETSYLLLEYDVINNTLMQ